MGDSLDALNKELIKIERELESDVQIRVTALRCAVGVARALATAGEFEMDDETEVVEVAQTFEKYLRGEL